MILSLQKILALSPGCSTSSGTGSLRIFPCSEISPTVPCPGASCSSPVFVCCHRSSSTPGPGQGIECKSLFSLKVLWLKNNEKQTPNSLEMGPGPFAIHLLGKGSSWISRGRVWVSVATEDLDLDSSSWFEGSLFIPFLLSL